MNDDKYKIDQIGSKELTVSRKNVYQGTLIAAALVVPFIAPSYQIALLVEIFILALYAMSLDLLMGYTGLVSFGHAAFFGMAAYSVGIFIDTGIIMSTWIVLGIGILVAGIIAIPMGYLSLKRHGIYFAMLTLAFSQIFYVVVNQDFMGLTGGSDGLVGIGRANSGIPGIIEFAFSDLAMYYLILVALLVSFVLLRRIVSSPFGSVLVAIRENEERVKYAGYNVQRYKLASFTLSGMFAGLAGGLFALYYRSLSPELLFWLMSGEALVIVLVGGMATLFGPILGAGLFVVIREIVSPFLTDWTIVLGAVFIISILYLPNGMISIRNYSFTEIVSKIKTFWKR